MEVFCRTPGFVLSWCRRQSMWPCSWVAHLNGLCECERCCLRRRACTVFLKSFRCCHTFADSHVFHFLPLRKHIRFTGFGAYEGLCVSRCIQVTNLREAGLCGLFSHIGMTYMHGSKWEKQWMTIPPASACVPLLYAVIASPHDDQSSLSQIND